MDIKDITLSQYMWLKKIKGKDFPNPITISNILTKWRSVWKFNKSYLGDKKYFPSNKSIKSISDTLGITVKETTVLIRNELAD